MDSFLNFGYLCKITDEDMKKFTSLLAAAGMILGLASCGSDGYTTAQFTYAENIPLEACDSLTLSVDHSFIYFKSVKAGQDVCDRLNGQIVDLVFGDGFRGQTIEEASKSYLDELTETYQKNAGSDYRDLMEWGDEYPEASCDWEDNMSGNLTTSYKDKYITYCAYIQLFYGGAHGSHNVYYRILDLETGEAVTEENIFAEGYEDAVSELIADGIREIYEGEPDGQDTLESIFFEDVHPNGNIEISEEGINWCFNTYEIAPYYVGTIEVLVPWSKLSGYLSNEFNFE